jgi:hypothetical protein
LGKGGFGQVYVGRRVSGGADRTGPDAYEVPSFVFFLPCLYLEKHLLNFDDLQIFLFIFICV